MLLEALAEALQATALSRTLAASVWLYPLVNTAHIVGIALLFGAIVPLDLRLVGYWPREAVDPLRNVLVPVAVAGLMLAVASGALLFATRPKDYLAEPLFALKLGLLVAAVLNAWWLRRSAAWRRHGASTTPPPAAWRAAGAFSIVLWLAVITTGRLIGYR
jgi:hypothetical protein